MPVHGLALTPGATVNDVLGAAGPPSISYLPTVAVAPSLVLGRKKHLATATNCDEIRRSTDNALVSIGFDASGVYDAAAANAHRTNAGASPTATVSVRRWFNQDGSGVDPIQTTNGSQIGIAPFQLVNGVPPLIQFTNGANRSLSIPIGMALNTRASTIFIVARPLIADCGFFEFGTTAGDRLAVVGSKTANGLQTWTATTASSTFLARAQPTVIGTVNGAASTIVMVDTATKTGLAARESWTTAGGNIGVGDNAIFTGLGDLFALIAYPAELNATDRNLVRDYLMAQYGVVASQTRQIMFDGDSITYGTGAHTSTTAPYQNLVRQLEPNLSVPCRLYNIGVFGQSANTTNTNRGNAMNRFNGALSKNVLHLLIGTNDLGNRASGSIVGYGTTVWTSFISPYITAAVAAGWDVIVGTLVNRSDASWQGGGGAADRDERKAEAVVLNGLISANAPGLGATVIDYAALSISCPDGLHPDPAGYAIMEAALRPVVNAKL